MRTAECLHQFGGNNDWGSRHQSLQKMEVRGPFDSGEILFDGLLWILTAMSSLGDKTVPTSPFLIISNLLVGVFAFGLFATDIFVNAGQVVTGHLTPYFLTVCKPNYTSTDCRAHHQFINNGNICTGDMEVIEKARRSFPSKHAALSIYSALYATVSMTVVLSPPRPASGWDVSPSALFTFILSSLSLRVLHETHDSVFLLYSITRLPPPPQHPRVIYRPARG